MRQWGRFAMATHWHSNLFQNQQKVKVRAYSTWSNSAFVIYKHSIYRSQIPTKYINTKNSKIMPVQTALNEESPEIFFTIVLGGLDLPRVVYSLYPPMTIIWQSIWAAHIRDFVFCATSRLQCVKQTRKSTSCGAMRRNPRMNTENIEPWPCAMHFPLCSRYCLVRTLFWDHNNMEQDRCTGLWLQTIRRLFSIKNVW